MINGATQQTDISATTRYCAVYGHPVSHSASLGMQNAGLAALGLDWRYLAFDVHPQRLPEAIAGAKHMKFAGLNLTVPHKLLALNIVECLDESARTWGAVNTIRFEARTEANAWRPLAELPADIDLELRAHGFNTDAEAITRALREDLGLEPLGTRVLLLGVGGAGRVAALKLAADGVGHLFLVNRTLAKAEEIAHEIRNRFPSVKVSIGYPKDQVDLILNATSLGLKADDAFPLEEAQFPLTGCRAVFDMIYRPAVTPLLSRAQAAGCRTANGLSMLLYQGAKSLELWSGKNAPVAVMRQALHRNVYGTEVF